MTTRSVITDNRMPELAIGFLLVMALVFGGGSRGAGDAMVIFAATPVVLLACLRSSWKAQALLQRLAMLLLIAVLSWHLVQLVPFPSDWIGQLPMRSAVLSDLHAAGAKPSSLPATLDAWATVRSLVQWLVFGAMVALLSTVGSYARYRLLKLCVLLGCMLGLIGYAQAAAGRHSVLRMYDYHHAIGAIGTFANRNHFASLMAMLAPLSLALATHVSSTRRTEAALWHGATVLLLVAAGLSFSRTGFVLACAAAVAVMLLLVRRVRLAAIGMVFACLASACMVWAYAWTGLSARLELDPLKDLRWQYLEYGWKAAKAYWPWGSGPGTFRYAYVAFEPLAKTGAVYALHAHDEFLELLVEWGAFGVLFVAVALALFVIAIRNKLIVARDRPPIMVGSVVAVTVPMLHSLVDYPLRTYAVMAVLAVPLSMLLSGTRGNCGGEA